MSYSEATKALLLLMEDAVTRNRQHALRPEEIAKLCKEISKLLDKQANPNTSNRLNGSAPIHFAATGMDLDLIEYLIRLSVDINAQVPKSLFTPLHFAALQVHPTKIPSPFF